MQAERRLERSRNGTTAAVPLTEANATAFFPFPSAMSAREAAAERALVAAGDFCATHFIFPCAEIAQASHFLPAKSSNEKVVVIFDCAQGGAIRPNKCAIILSDT